MNKIKLTLKSTYPYGKWKGVKVSDMLIDDDMSALSLRGRGDGCKYLEWVNSKCENIVLGNDILRRMEKIVRKRLKEQQDSEPCRSKGGRTNWNHWGNYDDRWLGISIQDMGYNGDGW